MGVMTESTVNDLIRRKHIKFSKSTESPDDEAVYLGIKQLNKSLKMSAL